MTRHANLGNKLGPRLAQLLAQGATHHYRATADARRRVGVMTAVDFFKTITHETRLTTRPLYHQLARHEGLPQWMRDTFSFMAHGQGEYQALLSYGVSMTGIGSSITQVLSNDLAPWTQHALEGNPNALLPAAGLADAVVRGIIDFDSGMRDAARQAINRTRFLQLVEAAKHWPDQAEVYELLRRGTINESDAMQYLQVNGFDSTVAGQLLTLNRVHLSPADAADMVVRGIITEDEGRSIARVNGMAAADFDRLVLDTGEPPGTQDLLFAYRRGIIDRARLEHGIRQSRTRNEWVPVIEALRHVPMNTADAIRAVVQNHLSDAEGRRIAEENGLDPAHWRPLVETAGEPASFTEMMELWNRGHASQGQVEQALREGRLKNKYIPQLLQLRHRLPPERTVVSMISHGTISHDEGMRRLLELGYAEADARALVANGSAAKTQHDRQLAKGEILALFEQRTIDQAGADRMLRALGYTEHEIGFLLGLARLKRVRRFRDAAVGHIKTMYVSHRIDQGQASGALDGEGVPSDERDDLLRIWGLERALNRRQLTEAQVAGLHRRGQLSDADALDRLTRMGYDPGDAKLLLGLA